MAEKMDLNAGQITQLQVYALQQVVKVLVNLVIQVAPDKQGIRTLIDSQVRFLCQNFDFRDMPPEYQPALRDLLENFAETVIAESGHPLSGQG